LTCDFRTVKKNFLGTVSQATFARFERRNFFDKKPLKQKNSSITERSVLLVHKLSKPNNTFSNTTRFAVHYLSAKTVHKNNNFKQVATINKINKLN